MAATRRGLDRIKTAALRQRASDSALAVKHHVSLCPKCRVDDFFPRHCCDDGWGLYKAAKRADNDLSVYLGVHQEGTSNVQETLW